MKKILFSLVLLLALGRTVAATVDWHKAKEVHPGILHLQIAAEKPRLMKINLIRVDLRNPKIFFTATDRAAGWGKPMPDHPKTVIRTERVKTGDFLKNCREEKGMELLVAANAAPWLPWEKPWNHRYGHPAGLAILNGKVICDTRPHRAVFVVYKDGGVDIVSSVPKSEYAKIQVAVSGFSILLRDGKLQDGGGYENTLHPRMAYGLSKKREFLYLMTIDGRQPEWSMGATGPETAQWLQAAGAYDAINMDGGGSATLCYWDEAAGKPKTVSRHKGGAERLVASNIGIGLRDREKELQRKIEPLLAEIEEKLAEIEENFWRNVMEFDLGSHSFLKGSSEFQAFNSKILAFRSRCDALHQILLEEGVDTERYPVAGQAGNIQSVWKNYNALHRLMMDRRNPLTRKGKAVLEPECIDSIISTASIPADLENYEALLDEIAIINTELFYQTSCIALSCKGIHCPPDWKNRRVAYCKFIDEDLLIAQAGEFFMTIRDLRKSFKGLRSAPYPKMSGNAFYDAICHIEEDLNRVESSFWDTVYKGGTIFSRYGELRQLLFCLYTDCRKFQADLLRAKIVSQQFNPAVSAITLLSLGESHDQELRRWMRRFFNRQNPLLPGSNRKRLELVYHLRAISRDAEGNTPPQMSPAEGVVCSYLFRANIFRLENAETIDEDLQHNIEIFRADSKEFKPLEEAAGKYFNAVRALRQTIGHWKNEFAPGSAEKER